MIKGNQDRINLFLPRSHCIKCKQNIRLIDLIPLFGYLIQMGKCRNCNNVISSYYPVNEIIHLLVGIILFSYLNFSLIFFVNYSLFFILYALFILDIKHFYLPFYLNILVCLIGVISNGYFDLYISSIYLSFKMSPLLISLIGLFIGYSTLWLINFIYKLVRGKDGIGGGDFILFAGIGSIIGPLALAPVVLIGSICLILLPAINPKKYSEEIPLGSGIILGFFIYSLFNFFELSFLSAVI